MCELLISIIVPVYNAEKYIEECVMSVVNQTVDNWELVLIDDGSTDNSLSLCEKYAQSYQKIKVYHKENTGQFDTRRFGIKKATGNYCSFLDSDDKLASNYCECISNYLTDKNVDCIIFGLEKVNDKGVVEVWKDEGIKYLTDKRSQFRKLLFNQEYNSLCRKTVRKELILKAIEYNQVNVRHGEDLIQSIAIFDIIGDVLFVPDVLYQYRDNEQSVTHTYNLSKFLDDTIAVQTYTLNFLQENKYFLNEDYEELSNKFVLNIIDIIRKIALEEDKKTSKNLCNQIKNSEIFKSMIVKYKHGYSRIGGKTIIYNLFIHDCFFLIRLIEIIYLLIKKGVRRRDVFE